MHIVVRKVSGQRMVVDLEDLDEMSIFEVKQLVEMEWEDTPSDEQVLIFKGKILKDDDVVNEVGIKDGATVILTKKKAKKKASPTRPTATAPAPMPAAPAGNPMIPPHMQEMMNNPFMQQMMDNMLSNPDFMEAMVSNNPQMQEVMRQNPELRHALRDPDTIRQAMQMLRDPSSMQQAMQNQDRAIANISNMPGGFNALSRMYNQVQAPMEDAMTMREAALNTTISEVDTSSGPTSSAMPNPFARPSPSSTATSSNNSTNNTTSNLNQANPNPFGANPFASNAFAFPFQQNQTQQQAPQNPFQAFPQFGGFPQPQQPAQQPYRFATQMTYLWNQGYTDRAENREALEETNGNLELAMAILLADRDDD